MNAPLDPRVRAHLERSLKEVTLDDKYVLETGRIVMDDSCAVLREKEDIKEFYLGKKESGVRGERRWKKKKTWR